MKYFCNVTASNCTRKFEAVMILQKYFHFAPKWKLM